MGASCPHCACPSAENGGAHALLAMLAADDLDAALEHGLLDVRPCPFCDAGCKARLIEARDARQAALGARHRYRARNQRLGRRTAEREAARAVPPSPAGNPAPLPAAAAQVLARALAKAAERRRQ